MNWPSADGLTVTLAVIGWPSSAWAWLATGTFQVLYSCPAIEMAKRVRPFAPGCPMTDSTTPWTCGMRALLGLVGVLREDPTPLPGRRRHRCQACIDWRFNLTVTAPLIDCSVNLAGIGLLSWKERKFDDPGRVEGAPTGSPLKGAPDHQPGRTGASGSAETGTLAPDGGSRPTGPSRAVVGPGEDSIPARPVRAHLRPGLQPLRETVR